MKRISISLGCLLVGMMTLAQTIATTLEPPQFPQAYWQKANNQRTTAWILTAGGAAMIVTGLVFVSADWDYFESKGIGIGLLVGGAAAITGGIILFNASKRNLRNAGSSQMQFKLKLENVQQWKNHSLARAHYPAIAIRIGLLY